MKLKLQNVGGITEPISIELKEGLNVIKSPNATGKTSFTHALKLISMNNQQLRNHPEFINDFSDKAIVEVDEQKRIIENKGFSPMSKTNPFFRIDEKENIIFAMPDNDFLNNVIRGRGEPIHKFLESFSDAPYFKQLIEKDGVLREVRDEINEEYGELNTEAKKAQSLNSKIEKEKKELEKLQKKKVGVQNKLEEMKHEVKMDKEEEGRLSLLKEDIENFDREIELTNGSINDWSENMERNEIEVKECKDAIERFLKEFKNIDKTIIEIDKKIEELEKELQDEDEGLYKQAEKTDTDIKNTENNIKEDENECSSCGGLFTQQQKKQRLKILNQKIDELNTKVRKTEEELDDLNKEKTNIKQRRREEYDGNQQEIKDLKSRNREYKDNIKDAKAVIERNTNDLKKKNEAMELIKKNVDPKIKILLEDEESLSRQVNTILSNIITYERDYEFVEDSEKKALKIKEKYEFLKRVEILIKEELANLKNVVKDNFNKKIMQVYNKLGFKDFNKIEIDETFKIIVTRKKKPQELNRLATSERVTIGVLIMLAGKEKYLPEYPFFVLDEVTTAYDPVRFKQIIDYLINETKTKYTIVTAFSPIGDKIKVEYKL